MDWKEKRKTFALVAGGAMIAVWILEPAGQRVLAMGATMVFMGAAVLWIMSLFLGRGEATTEKTKKPDAGDV